MSSNLRRDNLSREIGRTGPSAAESSQRRSQRDVLAAAAGLLVQNGHLPPPQVREM